MNRNKLKVLGVCKAGILMFFLSLSAIAFTQMPESITINDCYDLAAKNYPLVKQTALIEKTKQYSIENAAKGILPQFSISGQGSYQSEVTEIKIPNATTTGLSKDQYKLYGELNQSLTDGFIVKGKKELARAEAASAHQQVEVQLYQLKERINQIYFGILLMDAQLKQTELLKKDIQSGIENTNAAIANGIALKSNADNLQAEFLKTDQRTIELKATRNGYAAMLSLYIGQTITDTTRFIIPIADELQPTVNRHELKWYDAQKKSFDIQNKLINAYNLPRIGLFFQGGYGRPALNFLKNEFTGYYIGGLKLNWNFGGLYTYKNDKALLKIKQQNIDLQKEIFLFNTNISLSQQSNEVTKYQQLINTDNDIILLREKVKNTAKIQLANGTLTSNEYLTYINAEDQARQNLVLHQLQLGLARFNYQITSGN